MPAVRTATAFTAFLGSAAIAATLGAAAVVSAGTAGATSTDDAFMSVLSDQGIKAPRADAVSTALDVCSIFDGGGDIYDAVHAVSRYTTLSTEDSAFFVGASVATYCSEHEGAIS